MKKSENGRLKIPLEFDKAVSAFLKVKPEPKKPTKTKRGGST
jgi:hypothetical protein